MRKFGTVTDFDGAIGIIHSFGELFKFNRQEFADIALGDEVEFQLHLFEDDWAMKVKKAAPERWEIEEQWFREEAAKSHGGGLTLGELVADANETSEDEVG